MPELPEVETVKNTLNPQLEGVTIEDVGLIYPKMVKNLSPEAFKAQLRGQTFQRVMRRGKYLIFQLDDYHLISHLRMEGKYHLSSLMETVSSKHVHAIFKLDNQKQLLYEDVRKFGTFHLYDRQIDLEETPPFQVLGVEPFSPLFNESYVKEKLKNKKKPIKSLLLDQTVVTGLGNIYVDEVLFRAKVHPLTSSVNLTEQEVKDVIKYTREVLQRAIELKGTTIRTFSSAHGVAGSFQHELRVHQQEGKPCVKCQRLVEKIKVGGRGTYYCSSCQIQR